jgi:hypothetical protein
MPIRSFFNYSWAIQARILRGHLYFLADFVLKFITIIQQFGEIRSIFHCGAHARKLERVLASELDQ